MRFFKSATLAAVVIFSSLLEAQPVNLTLEQAKQSALDHNLNIVQADANVGAAQAAVLSAFGGYMPNLSASGTWGRYQTNKAASSVSFGGATFLSPATQSTINQFHTGINANWLLFSGFSQQANVGQASSRSVSTEEGAVRTRQSIVYQVESAYLNVLRNEQLVKVSDENLKRDNRQLDKITESSRVGAAAKADVYRQQSTVAADQFALITAQATYDKSKADLVDLIGLDVGKDYSFSDSSISLNIVPAQLDSGAAKYSNFNDLSQRALAARPDYKGAVESYNAASSGVIAARSTYFPSVSANAGYGLSSDALANLKDNKTLNWGLTVSWTLFDGFTTNSNVQLAVAQRRIAEITVAQTERDIYAQLKKAILDFQAARKQYEVSQDAVKSTTEDSKIAEERYNLGAGTLLDLLTANANLVQAQVNLVNSVYNYITAQKNVEYMIGEREY